MNGEVIQFTPPESESRISSAIFALVCLVPMFATVVFGAVDSATWVILSILWTIIVLLWLAESWSGGGIRLNANSLQIPLLGLIAIGLVQLLPLGGAIDPAAGVAGSASLSLDPYLTRLFVIRLVIFLTFLAAVLTFVNSESRLKRIVVLFVIFGATMAFFGILQRLANPEGIYGMRLTPQAIPFGPFVNQHHFAAFMQMTGGLTLGLLVGSDTAREKKYMLATALAISGVAVVLTGSRGGLLAFLTMAGTAFVLNFFASRSEEGERGGARSKVLVAAGGLALTAVVIGTALLIGGNDQVLRGIGAVSAAEDISTGRLHFWPVAIKIFLANPVIGAGFDAFGVAFSRYDPLSGLFRVEHAHNEYLHMLADGGILGSACIAAFIFLFLKKGFATISATKGFRRSAAIGALAGCLGIMVHSFFDFPLRTNSNMFVFLVLVTIAVVSVTPSHEKRRHRRH